MDHEEMVNLDSIDAALDSLVKAAGAGGDLRKAYGGVAIDQGGHVDERGQTRGGYAEGGDVGGLDSMMVGKMGEALIDAGFSADQIAAFMRGKADEDMDDEDEDDEDDEMAGMKGKFGKPADMSGGVGTNPRTRPSGGRSEKSWGHSADYFEKALDAYRDDPDVGDGMDVSPFMEGFVAKSAELHADLVKALDDQRYEQTDVNRKLAAAVYGIGQMLKSIETVTGELGRRLNVVERRPLPTRGARSLPQAQRMAKALGAGPSGSAENLTKSEVIRTLTYMNLEKGVTDIGGLKTGELAAQYEAGDVLHPAAYQAVSRFLQTNPHEAAAARSYR